MNKKSLSFEVIIMDKMTENELLAHSPSSGQEKGQSLREHSRNVAELARSFVVPQLEALEAWMGLNHDRGKATARFARRLRDPSVRVEHSLHGAKEAQKAIGNSFIAYLAAQCIAGHHTGLPDTGARGDSPEGATLFARLARDTEPLEPTGDIFDTPPLDTNEILRYLTADCTSNDDCLERIAFLTRYCFSALCDADSLDTMRFYNGGSLPPTPHSDLQRCLELIDRELSSFECRTELQKARSLLQSQVYENVNADGNVFLLNMPTGSGKTLCGMKFALQRALLHGKRRIIYVSGYNAIIDQTAEKLERLFGSAAELVRHQSTFSYDDITNMSDEDKARRINACENWDADMIVSTTVQLFESIAGCTRGKLRKLHALSDSVIILDELHTLPIKYLQPCLKAIALVTTCLNSEAIFMTATMPNYERLLHTFGSPSLQVTDLISDRSLYTAFRKCDFVDVGKLSDEELLSRCTTYPSSLVIVDKKKTARELYECCPQIYKKFHLSTYMTSGDRARTIESLKKELILLERDYPELRDVPPERRIVCFSTSLVEAGVDLDFSCVFRELAPLDSILQAGGRCNREGKRTDAKVFIFERSEARRGVDNAEQMITRSLMSEYSDISCEKCVFEYYERLIYSKNDELMERAFSRYAALRKNHICMNFRTYAEDFDLIEDKNVSVVVATDEVGRSLVGKLRDGLNVPERALQRYAVSVSRTEFDNLLRQGVITDFGKGAYCLTNMDYYSNEVGIGSFGRDMFDE